MVSIVRLPSSLFLILHEGKSTNFHCSLDSPWLLATYASLAGLCSYESLGTLELVHWEFVVSRPSEHLYKFSNTGARSHNEDCQPWHQTVIVICRLSSNQETSGFIPGTKNTITVTCQMLSKSSIALGTLFSLHPAWCTVQSEDHGLFRGPSLHSLDARQTSTGRCLSQDCGSTML